jgi:uncharacterized tellurite resistance protein B-like protein
LQIILILRWHSGHHFAILKKNSVMTSFFEHQRTSFKRNYLRNLIALASADGSLDSPEKSLIVSIGLRRGLKEWQISELLEETTKHIFFVPDSLGNRMNLLYDIMQIVYADGKVTKSEVTFVTNIVASLEMDAEIVDDILNLFSTRTPTVVEWNEFMGSMINNNSKPYVTIL